MDQLEGRRIKGWLIRPSFSIEDHEPVIEISLVHEDSSEQLIDYLNKDDVWGFMKMLTDMMYEAKSDTVLMHFLTDWGFTTDTILHMMEDFRKWRLVSGDNSAEGRPEKPN